MHSAICHADLLRAFHALAPRNDAGKRAIAAMLGFDWRSPNERPGPDSGLASGARRRQTDADMPIEPWKPPLPPQPTRPPPEPDAPLGGGIRISSVTSVAVPPQLTGVTALTSDALARPTVPAPRFTPLFRSQWTRAILAASLSARRPIGPPDLARAVEVIARGEALSTLPCRPILTLAHGVQALIDVGEGMQPFWQDRTILRHDLKRIVGNSLELLHCAGTPGRIRAESEFEWSDGARLAPRSGACVLIVSDFGLNAGLARGASPQAWISQARRLARRGHRVVGFIPYPRARWPADLARAIDLVSWDRATTAGRISFARSRRRAGR